jgi:hypothetical protein
MADWPVEIEEAHRVGRIPLLLRTALAATDSGGVAVMSTGRGQGSAVVRVTGQGHLTETRPLAVWPPDALLEIQVTTAAMVEGRLSPVEGVVEWGPTEADVADRLWADGVYTNHPKPTVSLLRASDEDRPERIRDVVVGEDGSFRVEAVPAGTWGVFLHVGPRALNRAGIEIGTIAGLAAGETRQVTFDVSTHAPARFEGSVFLNGAVPPARAELLFHGPGRTETAARIEDGGAEFRYLAAGEYWPGLKFRTDDGELVLYAARPIRLRAGQRLRQTLEFERRAARVRVLDAKGEPVVGRRVVLRSPADADVRFGSMSAPVTDAMGRATLQDVPPFPVDIVIWMLDLPEDEAVRLPIADTRYQVLATRALPDTANSELELRMVR